MIINQLGDITKVNTKYIVHQCNCVTIRSKNLAKTVFDAFPYADCYSIRKQNDVPGTIKIFGNGKTERYVINLFGQFYPGKAIDRKDCKSNRLKWFHQGLFEISKIENLESIAFPKGIGCGAAAGNWKDYLELIEKFEKYVNDKFDVKVYIIEYKPKKESWKLFND